MATKAENFKYLAERSGPKKAPKPRRDWPARPGAAHPADERVRHGRTASRNFSLRSEKNAPYELEETSSGKPTRKSTRRSFNRMKPSHPQRAVKSGEDVRQKLVNAARRRP